MILMFIAAITPALRRFGAVDPLPGFKIPSGVGALQMAASMV